jgi:aryl-alcohol dehydrogenase-like predicted oxidoreductase
VLATKVHMPMGEVPSRRGSSRRWIIREAEQSLRRLATDWIDLYQVHRYDPAPRLPEYRHIRADDLSILPATTLIFLLASGSEHP